MRFIAFLTVVILCGSDKLVIARLPRTIWPLFLLFPIFSYFAVISRQNIRNSENVGHIALGTVR